MKPLHIPHTDFIPVIKEGGSGHGKQKSKGNLGFLRGKCPGKSVHIMVSGRDTNQSLSIGLSVVFQVTIHEFPDIPLPFRRKEGLLAAEQIIVMGGSEMQKKIHMEASLQGLIRLAPFRHHHCIGKFFLQKGSHLFPEGNGTLAFRIILYHGMCHIHSEAVTAHGKPEAHHIL